MNQERVLPQHLRRKAVIYIRQSTSHQVLTHLESQRMQRAMKEHALRLGWTEESIEIVEADTGTSAHSTAGRQGYKKLLSELALGEIGIVLSYESTRLSRNCSDWYRLLDLCALNDCLIGDRDGVYDAASPNGRLLLGMKGILSEVELHTLRGRLLAGIANKAERGELALVLPVGFVRRDDGSVVKDPDLQVQQTISLVFGAFLEMRSCRKVVRHMRTHGLLLPRRPLGEPKTSFRPPTVSALTAMLRNPAYAGAFAYGRTRNLPSSDPHRARAKRQRRPQDQWRVLRKDHFAGYIDWDTFQRIQTMLSDNYAEYASRHSRGVPRDGAALLVGLCYCGICGHKMGVAYKASARYQCSFLHTRASQGPICQLLRSEPIDRFVENSFFAALSPIELDVYDAAYKHIQGQHQEVCLAQERQLQRLRYEVTLSRRQYDRVDPENRLVASELERRWEAALRALEQAEKSYAQDQRQMQTEVERRIPLELRTAFSSVGQALPGLWPNFPMSTRKALLRCLIDKVVLQRLVPRERVLVRIVWRGGAYTETELLLSMPWLTELADYPALRTRVLELEAEGHSDVKIAQMLTKEGFHSPQKQHVVKSTVRTIRHGEGRYRGKQVPRPRHLVGALTVGQAATALGVNPQWIYGRIQTGVIKLDRDPEQGIYRVPSDSQTLEQLRQLRDGLIHNINLSKGHQDE